MSGHELIQGMLFLRTPERAKRYGSQSAFAPRYGNKVANAEALGPLTSASAHGNGTQPTTSSNPRCC